MKSGEINLRGCYYRKDGEIYRFRWGAESDGQMFCTICDFAEDLRLNFDVRDVMEIYDYLVGEYGDAYLSKIQEHILKRDSGCRDEK